MNHEFVHYVVFIRNAGGVITTHSKELSTFNAAYAYMVEHMRAGYSGWIEVQCRHYSVYPARANSSLLWEFTLKYLAVTQPNGTWHAVKQPA